MKSFNISYENAKWSGLENIPNKSVENEFILIFASRYLLEHEEWLKNVTSGAYLDYYAEQYK
jgi:hypothetical protein